MAIEKVLVVDDDRGLLTLMKARLEAAGYGVALSGSGEDALAVVHPGRAVLVGLGSGDGVRCRINLRDFDRGVGPEVAEVAEQPGVVGLGPARVAVVEVA